MAASNACPPSPPGAANQQGGIEANPSASGLPSHHGAPDEKKEPVPRLRVDEAFHLKEDVKILTYKIVCTVVA